MIKILLADSNHKVLHETLAAAGLHCDLFWDKSAEELKALIPEYDGLVLRSKFKITKEIIDTASGYLSMGIDTLIKLFNTECVVIYGELVEYDNSLIDEINNNLNQYSMNALNRTVPLVSSSFGENAALMGSFSLILEKILQLEIQ